MSVLIVLVVCLYVDEVDLHDYGYCVKNGYMFAYLDKDCTYWISKEGEMKKCRNGLHSSTKFYGTIPNKKFRVVLDGDKCTVVEFENNYEQERNSTLWYALYIDGKISQSGLLINSKYFMFKEFKDDMMTEYQYDYDVEKGEIIENKREVIYQGKYKNDSYEHYPPDKSANEKEDKRSQTSSTSPVNNPADNVNKRDADPKKDPVKKENEFSSIPVIQKKNDGSEIKRLTYGKEFKDLSLCIKDKGYDDVQEIQILESGLPKVTTLTIMDIQSLETIVFSNRCCNSLTILKISNLPKLKRITFGNSCCLKATKVDLISRLVISMNHHRFALFRSN